MGLFLPKAFYPLDVMLVAVTVQKRDGGGLPLIFLHRVLFCSMREKQSCKIIFFKRAATLDMTKRGSQTPSILFTSTTFIMAPGKTSIAVRKKCFCTTLGFPIEKIFLQELFLEKLNLYTRVSQHLQTN